MLTKVPSADEGLYTQQIDFEPVLEVEESSSDTEEELDFDEYLWMGDEEEFEKTEMLRLEEEALMEECVEAMLEESLLLTDLRLSCSVTAATIPEQVVVLLPGATGKDMTTNSISESTLNPLAIEFIPAH